MSRRIMQYGRVMRKRCTPADLGTSATTNGYVRYRWCCGGSEIARCRSESDDSRRHVRQGRVTEHSAEAHANSHPEPAHRAERRSRAANTVHRSEEHTSELQSLMRN